MVALQDYSFSGPFSRCRGKAGACANRVVAAVSHLCEECKRLEGRVREDLPEAEAKVREELADAQAEAGKLAEETGQIVQDIEADLKGEPPAEVLPQAPAASPVAAPPNPAPAPAEPDASATVPNPPQATELPPYAKDDKPTEQTPAPDNAPQADPGSSHTPSHPDPEKPAAPGEPAAPSSVVTSEGTTEVKRVGDDEQGGADEGTA